MFGLFKKKSYVESLQEKYKILMQEAHKLSTTSRKESDNKLVEANEVLIKIEAHLKE